MLGAISLCMLVNAANISRTVNASQCELIARAQRLRSAVWAQFYHLGLGFAQDLKRGWDEMGFKGMAAAVWDLSQLLSDEIGSWDLYVEAKSLAADLATA